MDKKKYYVYILHCENDSYYTGYTIDLPKRFQSHVSGKGSKYTRSFKPTAIAQHWQLFCDKSMAMNIERSIKKLSHSQKVNLISHPELLFKFCDIELVSA